MATVEHTYPLTVPTSPHPRNSRVRLERVVGEAQSAFTRASQVQRHQGSQWFLDLQYPPLADQVVMGQWEAFMLKLQGRYGTFEFGDPDRQAPQGTISGSPTVSGASQTGNSIDLAGLPETEAGLLLPGDMISFAGYDYMHKVVASLDSDSSGAGAVIFEPTLRSSPGDGVALQYTNVKGLFRLVDSAAEWDSDENAVYGFAIRAKEAV